MRLKVGLSIITGGGPVKNAQRMLLDEAASRVRLTLDVTHCRMPKAHTHRAHTRTRVQVLKYMHTIGRVIVNDMQRTFNCGVDIVMVAERAAIEVLRHASAEHYVASEVVG